ncbi:MAG: hypothetical protein EOP48_02375 [Sphingobacteriales bacterium]|nr:MAG: hypothetical protein EOP48_02375 [Sphingobacteriales bacterium]
MKKTKLNAEKMGLRPLKYQTNTLFNFDGGNVNLASTTHPTTLTIKTFTTGIRVSEIEPLAIDERFRSARLDVK